LRHSVNGKLDVDITMYAILILPLFTVEVNY